jgi:spore coat protein U-like protein
MKKKRFLLLYFIFSSTLADAAVSCSVSVQTLSFGTIDPLSSGNLTSIGAINLNCTGGPTTYTIKLSQGNGSMVQRVMKSGPHSLNYNLYTSSSYANVLGDGSAGSLTINGATTDNTTDVSHSVYGKISNTGLSSTDPGVYTDQVSVTVFY